MSGSLGRPGPTSMLRYAPRRGHRHKTGACRRVTNRAISGTNAARHVAREALRRSRLPRSAVHLHGAGWVNRA
jgi:hypothetical protein